MSSTLLQATPSRLRTAAFAPIGDEGRTELVESRIVQAISVGAFVEGERLPSETELSALLGVAVVTVREALSGLRHRGLIETRRGRNGGSFVRPSHGAVEEVNARALMDLPRVALADLGVHYEVIVGACAEFACMRATADELGVVARMLEDARGLERHVWRRRVTEVQLELAALSQSVRLTTEHVRVQTEFTPLLALQDLDAAARLATHDALAAQIAATERGEAAAARAAVRESVRSSVRWLVGFRSELLADPADAAIRATLEARRGGDDRRALDAEGDS
ncbi:GntR family transcriptional regulator [Leucobacter allii]|uniref:GntR family transcriptional regulator n=1 Tax=Leucobacter allii TaxID=2932247 RepID=A0ABY4FMS5_9MICO|nr:GntR family transcriptional regulator [Leucobacter allii]UOQ57574.1 GntR family transcriptional regulator [Leucobacter allii]UOR02107.1 GntR family transcriptional regulator [Leucobacter allii]